MQLDLQRKMLLAYEAREKARKVYLCAGNPMCLSRVQCQFTLTIHIHIPVHSKSTLLFKHKTLSVSADTRPATSLS